MPRRMDLVRQRQQQMLAGQAHPPEHGTVSTYTNWACRCDACRAANTADNLAGRRRRNAKMLVGLVSPPHGVYSTYTNYGCRCDRCRDAASKRRSDRRKELHRKRAGREQA